MKGVAIKIFGRQFRPRVVPSLFCVFFIVLFVILGIWQIHRYEYKKALLSHYTQEMHESPISLQASSQAKDLQFKQIKVKGEYLNSMTAFIQNRYSNNHVGYDVLTPLKIAGNSKLLLVNRGWVPFRRDLKFAIN